MSECIINEPLPVSLPVLPHFNNALCEHFTCRRSLAIRGKRAARFLDRVPCSVESDAKSAVMSGSKAVFARSVSIGIAVPLLTSESASGAPTLAFAGSDCALVGMCCR